MGDIENLKKELKRLQSRREEDAQVKRLKKQIKAERFAQTKGGKVFNAIGDFGLKAGKRILAPTPQQVAKAGRKGSKRIKKNVKSVEDVMKSMDDAVGQFNF